MYFVKGASRRRPIHVFCHVIVIVQIKSLVICKAVCKDSTTCKAYIPKISEMLTGSVPGAVVSSLLAKFTRTITASSATLHLERRECDNLIGRAPKHVFCVFC